MASIQNDIIQGFNSFLEGQKKEPGELRLTLVQFDDQYERLFADAKAENWSGLDTTNFVPRGGTALLDAIGLTIDEVGQRYSKTPDLERPERVIFIILSDGEENSSIRENRQTIFKRIRHQEDTYNWQFVFMGTNQDAIQEASAIGIHINKAITFDNTNAAAAYQGTSGLVSRMRNVPVGSMGVLSYTGADRDEAAKKKH